MRNEYLLKAKQELEELTELMPYTDEVSCARKEVSLTIIGALIRKCADLEWLKLDGIRHDFNSIIHSHLVIHINDGTLHVLSDNDKKNKNAGAKIDTAFIKKLNERIDEWTHESLV